MGRKRFDIVNDERFVFGMDRGISLYFDPENFLHAANSDEFAPVETEFLAASEIPSEITREIEAQISGAEIVDAEKEFSVLNHRTKVLFISFGCKRNRI